MDLRGILASSKGDLELKPIVLAPVQSHQLRIKVAYAGINRADLDQAKGEYPPPPGASEVLGLEASGVVEEIGSEIKGFSVGDRVMALVPGGAFATRVVADSQTTLLVPPHMSLKEAAAVPESLYTFWANAYQSGGLRSGMTFMIHGGASGLGSFSIAMAKALGCKVVSTARGKERVDFAKRLGADLVLDTSTVGEKSLGAELLKQVGENQVDMIMDHLGAELLPTHLRLLKKCGRIVLISARVGSEALVDLDTLIVKRIQIIGSVLRSRSVAEKAEICSSIVKNALPLLAHGFKVPVDEVFPLEEIGKAFARVEGRRNTGKVLLEVDGEVR